MAKTIVLLIIVLLFWSLPVARLASHMWSNSLLQCQDPGSRHLTKHALHSRTCGHCEEPDNCRQAHASHVVLMHLSRGSGKQTWSSSKC
jgi:hypothetical protein